MAPTRVNSQVRAIKADESGCTPGSVPRFPRGSRGDGHPSRTGVATGLVRSTRGLGRAALDRPRRVTFEKAAPLDLAPGGVYLAAQVTLGTGGLLHHRFTLTEGRTDTVPGGLLSVALSRGSPRVAVSHHPALWSPDVPREAPEGSTRPSARLVCRVDHGTGRKGAVVAGRVRGGRSSPVRRRRGRGG